MFKHFLIFGILASSYNSYASEFLTNAKQDVISPYTTDAKYIAAVGAGFTLLGLMFKQSSLQSDIEKDRPLGKSSKFFDKMGQCIPNISYGLYMGIDYLITKDKNSLRRTELMAKSSLYAGAMTDILKFTIPEKRPNGSTRSFPSGHTTTAFAFSSIIAMEHSIGWGIAANALAATVGFSRMNDNAHYLHDVLAGATIGSMYGVGVYLADLNRSDSKTNGSATTFMLVPIQNGMQGHLAINF